MEENPGLQMGEPLELETEFGVLQVRHLMCGSTEGLIITGAKQFAVPVPVRVQSSCVFSESLHSIDCDCARQLHASLHIVVEEGGLLVYLYEEGRGAGLRNKMEAMRMQAMHGLDTAKAYTTLGLDTDPRDYRAAALAIKAMIDGLDIELLTNNPRKIARLREFGLHIIGRRPLVFKHNEMTARYLEEKARVLEHMIDG